eukprot:3974839-Prymnesium_polylepis.1
MCRSSLLGTEIPSFMYWHVSVGRVAPALLFRAFRATVCYCGMGLPELGPGVARLSVCCDGRGQKLLGKSQRLVKVYWLLNHVKRLPQSLGDGLELAAKELMSMAEKGVLEGLELNAHARCKDPITVQQADAARRNDDGLPNPMLKPAVGMRMVVAEDIAKWLGVDQLHKDCELPQHVVDIARRQRFQESTSEDRQFVKQLKALASQLDTPIQGGDIDDTLGLVQIMRGIATVCGMELVETKQGEHHTPSGHRNGWEAQGGQTPRLHEKLPDIVDDWKRFSPKLGYSVATVNWQTRHDALDEDDMQEGLVNDTELV